MARAGCAVSSQRALKFFAWVVESAESKDFRGCATRAGDPDVGRWRIVLDDRSHDSVLPRLHQPMATAVSRQPVGGAPPPVLRVDAHDPDADDGSARPGEDPTGTAGRQHPLEYAQARARAEDS